ncbi:MAG: hypothetical protein VB094_07710 [Oscillibacter sp.]|nr:hypothetical protein [Oscillibacter sp.]
MKEDFTNKKRLMDAGSIVSAAGLAFYFLGQGLSLPRLVTGIVTAAATLLSFGTLFLMIACRQDGGKAVISGNRLVGQGSLTVLLAMALAVMLKEFGFLQ